MKLALLIGINYVGTNAELRGCINDVVNLKEQLVKEFDYKPENIVTLTDDTSKKPTAYNIIMQLYEMVIKANNNPLVKEVWFSYSGHGTYIVDRNNDEDDGKDECLVPIDYTTSGVITDDLLNHVVSMLNSDKKMICIVDACHSGTSIDLPFRYIPSGETVVENYFNTVKADIISISGCLDIQTSADAYGLEQDGGFSGAMTSSLLYALDKNNYTVSYISLLKDMREYLKSKNFIQIPQLCSSKIITDDMYFSNKESKITTEPTTTDLTTDTVRSVTKSETNNIRVIPSPYLKNIHVIPRS